MTRREHGFTLVELLVAITLFAVLATTLFGALRFGTRAAEQGTARLEWTEEVAVAANFLRSQIAGAEPLQKDEDGQKSVAFEGQLGSVEFVALPPAHLAGGGGWQTLHVGLEDEGGRGRLVLTWRLVRPDAAAPNAPSRTVLLDGVTSVAFGYFGATAAGEDPQWHNRWQDAISLPLLMRLRVEFENGRHTPDLIVALRAAPPEPGF
jgi:general secretion pathway protein J